MVKIAFILLCHKNPDGVIQQARTLLSRGDYVAIHVDKSAPAEIWHTIQDALEDEPNVTLADRIKCGWGQWSLVRATLNAMQSALTAFEDVSHFYLISGDCMPIKSRAYMAKFLEQNPYDFIEHHDFFESDWIKVGLKEERLIYRHFVNERDKKPLFYKLLRLQRALGLKRQIPSDLRFYIGSQWFVLRRNTVEQILKFVKSRKDIVRFFKTTWIPDEIFFQTLVMHLVPKHEVQNKTLTFLAFSDYGLPINFYDDHFALLRTQGFLFARKISEQAEDLRNDLRTLFNDHHNDAQTADTAGPLIQYLTRRGRTGQRFGKRFWERGGQVGRGQEVLIVACKKWHVARRFVAAVRQINIINALGYVFDEQGEALPNLGGIEGSTQKRSRHRRAFLKLLFEIHKADRLLICMDSSNIETVRDITRDSCSLKVLEIKCQIDDEYLIGHAQRINLLQPSTDRVIARPLIQSLHQQFRDESDALRDLDLTHFYCWEETGEDIQNIEAVSRFLTIPPLQTQRIVSIPDFFS